jgi:AraC-like DNA-binding protein
MIDGAENARLPALAFGYGELRGEAAFATWAATTSATYEIDAEVATRSDFRFGLSAWDLGPIMIGAVQSDPIRSWRSSRTIAASGIDHYMLQVYEGGRFLGTVKERETVIEPGDIWVIDMSRGAATNYVGFRSINIAIPRLSLAPLLRDPDALHGLHLSARTPLGGMLSSFLVSLKQQAPRLSPIQANAIAQSTIHLVAGAAGPAADAGHLARKGLATALLTRMRAFIEAELANPDLGAELLCGHFGVSRASLYRLFSPFGGVHVFIRRRRLARAFRELTAPSSRLRIGKVAERWGFENTSSFTRAFRESYGLTPRDARAAGGGGFIANRDRYGESTAMVGHWLHDLMLR